MASLEALKQSVSGIVIAREDGSYAAAREQLLWNAHEPERFPDAIVGATCVEDVQAAVRFARKHGMKVTASSGGHHWSGVALQAGLVIDLSALNHVKIDPVARTAEIGAGLGRSAGTWGIDCFSIEGLDVVTADGELCRASASENPDIFWAARGAGPAFFGVVTAYRLRLQRSPRAITTWTERRPAAPGVADARLSVRNRPRSLQAPSHTAPG
jgi:FAD/FMN-containing dehydrogenase